MFKEVKTLMRNVTHKLNVICAEMGKILTETDKILDRWNKYCRALDKAEFLI